MYGAIKHHVLMSYKNFGWVRKDFDLHAALRHNLDYLLGTFLALPGKLDFEDMGIRKDLHLKCDGGTYMGMLAILRGPVQYGWMYPVERRWFGIVSIPTIPLASSCFFNEGGFTDIEKQIGTLWHERGEDLCSDLLALVYSACIAHIMVKILNFMLLATMVFYLQDTKYGGSWSHTEVDINNDTVGVQNVDIIDASVVEDLHRQRDEEDYFEDEEDETGWQYASDNDESNIPNVL
ncbi:hypothetical protein ACJX0J_012372 [Zea mays]